jgi:hypothetical protein
MAIKTSNSARRFLGVGIATAAVLASLLGAAAPASARTVTPAAPKGNSCSLDLNSGALTCVPNGQDLNAAVLKEQGVRVLATAGARGASAAAVTPDSVESVFVLSQLYDDASYGGSYFQLTGPSACNGTSEWDYNNLGTVGWTGRVSSFKSFANCTTKVWQGTNETGAAYGYNVNAASLGAMNDQAHSVSMK